MVAQKYSSTKVVQHKSHLGQKLCSTNVGSTFVGSTFVGSTFVGSTKVAVPHKERIQTKVKEILSTYKFIISYLYLNLYIVSLDFKSNKIILKKVLIMSVQFFIILEHCLECILLNLINLTPGYCTYGITYFFC